MWERFSEGAKAAVFYADEEAKKREEGCVGTEHLLLGILRDPTREVVQALASLGLSAEELAAKVRLGLPPSAMGRPASQMTLTREAHRALALGERAAKEMSGGAVGAEHLLLGIAASGEGLGFRVLDKSGSAAEKLREAIQHLNE